MVCRGTEADHETRQTERHLRLYGVRGDGRVVPPKGLVHQRLVGRARDQHSHELHREAARLVAGHEDEKESVCALQIAKE